MYVGREGFLEEEKENILLTENNKYNTLNVGGSTARKRDWNNDNMVGLQRTTWQEEYGSSHGWTEKWGQARPCEIGRWHHINTKNFVCILNTNESY